ncbi:zinc finger protein 780B-like [Ochlerotatus camptorhynchus]|uniref:zinc finger protein 780B-like n=1 Tax=Ochlerotatus camptorhynchus TaxID=644619 RepID=UPI0031D988D4
MSLGCRICHRTEVDRLISISRTVSEQQKLISDMLTDVSGSKMEEPDSLPQHVCNACFGQLDQTYSLRMVCRRALRMMLLNPVGGTISRCLICCASNDEKMLIAIDRVYERRKMKISDMIEYLIGELINDRSPKYACSSCSIKLDLAYEFKRNCLKSELKWLQKASYPWERMEVDGSNPEHLIIDVYAEVVQCGAGKAQCSICLLTIDLDQLGKKCEGCKLEFRKCDTMQANTGPSPAEESSALERDCVGEEENSEQDDEEPFDTDSPYEDAHFPLEMECAGEEESARELYDLAEKENDDEHFEVNCPKVATQNSEHLGYVEEPEKVFDIIEEYPDDPFPTLRRKGPCCCKCFKFFATKSDLADHQTQSHAASTGSGKLSCDVCLTLHANQQALNQHRKSLDTFVYDFCRSCQIVFESPRLFRQHKLMYHMDLEAIKDAESNFETEIVVYYDCCVLRCYNRYSSEEHLQKHLNVAHRQEAEQMQENTCQYCKGVFISKSNLLNHWRSEKERYVCRIDSCSYMRMNKSTMWQHCSQKPHVKAYSETKVLVPDMKHFTVIGELDSNTDILLRKCLVCCSCFLCFETKEALAAHSELHRVEDGQPFQCQICRRGFTKVGLSQHSRFQEIPTHYYCRTCKTFLWRKLDYAYHKVANHLYDDDLSDKIETVEDHSFTCCGCWKVFQTEDELLEHRQKNHPPVPSNVFTKSMMYPKCDYCHQFKGSMELLEQHITIYESRTTHSCKVFGCVFQTKDMDHMRRHIIHGTHKDPAGAIIGIKSTGPDNYRCCVPRCDFRCFDYDAMIEHGKEAHVDRREHMSICHSDSQFTCPVCCKGFDQQISLYRHKHDKKKLRCRGCQKHFHRDMYFAHVAQCTEILKCYICDKVMNSKDTLQNHLSAIHSVRQKADAENNLHVCSICGKQVKKIKQHLKRHTNKRNWECSTCGARFKDRAILNNHERTHTNERNFPCRQGCDKRYKGQGDRDRHEKSVHLGIKPFVCVLCKESFVRDRDLRLHKRKHTGLKLYPCTYCSASFDKLSEFEEHCTHHGTAD